eukprot:scaffold130170_cov26-Tisochrysis_lutea.AAC.2
MLRRAEHLADDPAHCKQWSESSTRRHRSRLRGVGAVELHRIGERKRGGISKGNGSHAAAGRRSPTGVKVLGVARIILADVGVLPHNEIDPLTCLVVVSLRVLVDRDQVDEELRRIRLRRASEAERAKVV